MLVVMVCIKQTFAAPSDTIISTLLDLDSYQPWVIYGDENGNRLGWSVSGAGDVNGDGFDDVIVGAPVLGPDQEGTVFVYHGRAQGLTSTPDWTMDGGVQGVRFGNSVSGAGDVNGDGYDDVIIGAEDYKVAYGEPGDPKSGAAFVYLGSEDGLSDTPAWRVLAEVKEIGLGHAVSSAGDVNGDGFDDVIVGAPNFESDSAEANEGKVYLYLGSSDVMSTTAHWTYECDLVGATCGNSLGDAGDIDGDGFDDVIVGAPHFDVSINEEGAAFVFQGSPSGLNAAPDGIILGDQEDGELGSSVAGAGDVDGDGFDDIIIGAKNYPHEGELNMGAAFLYKGSADGLNLTHDWESFGSEVDSLYGASVHEAGDVDNDGYGDVIIGAYYFGTNGGSDQPDEGAAYLYKGSPTGLEISPDWITTGSKAEAQFGFSVGAAGDVNGDGGGDVIIGAPYYKFDEKTVVGSALVYFTQEVDLEYSVFIPLLVAQDGE